MKIFYKAVKKNFKIVKFTQTGSKVKVNVEFARGDALAASVHLFAKGKDGFLHRMESVTYQNIKLSLQFKFEDKA